MNQLNLPSSVVCTLSAEFGNQPCHAGCIRFMWILKTLLCCSLLNILVVSEVDVVLSFLSGFFSGEQPIIVIILSLFFSRVSHATN
jgi:hypothetical protein